MPAIPSAASQSPKSGCIYSIEMKSDPTKPLRFKDFAKEIDRPHNYVTAMIRAGFVPDYPGRISLKHGKAWLQAHLDFKPSEWLTPEMTAKLKKKALKEERARRAGSAAGK
jgi:hypothetical protein